jgi:hypothetical protein
MLSLSLISGPAMTLIRDIYLSLLWLLGLGLSWEGIVAASLLSQLQQLGHGLLNLDWLATILARGVVSIADVDLAVLHLLVTNN